MPDKSPRCVSLVVRKRFPYMWPLDERVCTIHCCWPVRIFRTIRDPYRPFFSVSSPSTSHPPTTLRNGSLTAAHKSFYAYRSSVALEFHAYPVVCPPPRRLLCATAVPRQPLHEGSFLVPSRHVIFASLFPGRPPYCTVMRDTNQR